MKILHLTNSMNPAYGGLSTFLHALAPALTAHGHPSEIVSLDAADCSFLRAIAAPVHALGPVKHGFGYAPKLGAWLARNFSRFDAVIVHGLWQYPGFATLHAAQRIRPAVPYFVFTHGMLDPWFKRTYPLKHLRKLAYWVFAERRVLRRAVAVLFTCEEERRLARATFPAASYRERVVTFGTSAPPDDATAQRAAFFAAHPGLRDRPFWLFLARIHPKKGPDLLIDAYAQLCAEDATLPRLVIAGPCSEPAYLAELQTRAVATCAAGSVVWTGMLDGAVKWGALRAADVFVLPSHQENFGLAVVEALACGTPVLLSDQVNIWREIIADHAGLAEPDTAAGTLQLLRRWRALANTEKAALRAAAPRTFAERYEMSAVARNLVTTLQTHLT